jgi:hypothetical protein
LEVFSLKDISSLPTMEEIGELSEPSITVQDEEESE